MTRYSSINNERIEMICMNSTHPSFDFALELLCTIPISPHYAEASLLQSDFDISNEELAAHVSDLKKRGFAVEVFNLGKLHNGGRGVWVEARGREAVMKATEHYWNEVYTPVSEHQEAA